MTPGGAPDLPCFIDIMSNTANSSTTSAAATLMNPHPSSLHPPPPPSSHHHHLVHDTAAAAAAAAARNVKHKRRYCRAPGCTRIVKSQGLCQRHGAKPRKCKVEGCDKQAQGNFDGMCKSHFKAHKRATTPLPPKPVAPTVATSLSTAGGGGGIVVETTTTTTAPLIPPHPEGESVYDRILPASIAWHASFGSPMPLIQHLKEGFDALKPPAWHRNEERRARGLFPVHNPATQLEGWERELVWMEILILTGNPDSSFRHLARGWGRDKGFHMVLAQFICERRGNVERKKREKGGSARMKSSDEDDDRGGGTLNHRHNQQHLHQQQHHSNHHHNNHHSYHHNHHNHPHHYPHGTPNLGGHAGHTVWDDPAACYGDAAYNEALAADLLEFHSPTDFAAAEKRLLEGSFSFDPEDGDGSYDSSLISSSEDGGFEQDSSDFASAGV